MIETKRLLLRPLELSDEEDLLEEVDLPKFTPIKGFYVKQ